MLCRNVGLLVEEPKISMSNLKRRIVFNLTSCSIKTTLFARANKEYRDKSKRKNIYIWLGGQHERGQGRKDRDRGAPVGKDVRWVRVSRNMLSLLRCRWAPRNTTWSGEGAFYTFEASPSESKHVNIKLHYPPFSSWRRRKKKSHFFILFYLSAVKSVRFFVCGRFYLSA